MTIYDKCMWAMFGVVAGFFAAAAIGGWLERRHSGKVPFIVVRHVEPFKFDRQPSQDAYERGRLRGKVN